MSIFNKKLESMSKNAVDSVLLQTMEKELKSIYDNKSSDEYKCHGNITLSPQYKTIEESFIKMAKIKGLNKSEISDLNNLFNALHRPVWNKMVTEYINEPNEQNTVFATVFTVGYRLLISEISYIFASTVATPKGLEYKPTRIQRKQSFAPFIRSFNVELENRIYDYIREESEKDEADKPVQEAASDIAAAGLTKVLDVIPYTFRVISRIFKSAAELNPVALINAMLSKSYTKKVEKFNEIEALYNATQKSYEEYMRKPEKNRKEKIESRYLKDMEKYNIKMNNMKAELDHYDSRAVDEAVDTSTEIKKKHRLELKKPSILKKKDNKKDDKDDNKKEEPKKEDKPTTSNDDKKETSSNTSTTSNDDIDF